ncbi:MAG: hypothetical protein M3N28_04515 [Actinomycetota bacterium]|nr:hypothetical protein [Actinomycetota bacterium]
MLALVVIGRDARAVGRAVRSRRVPGVAVAGFVGDDEAAARHMAEEMLGGVDEVVWVADEGGAAGPTAAAPPDA